MIAAWSGLLNVSFRPGHAGTPRAAFCAQVAGYVRDLGDPSWNRKRIDFVVFEGKAVRFKIDLGSSSYLPPDVLGDCDHRQINMSTKSFAWSEAWVARALKHLEADNPQEALNASANAINLRLANCHASLYQAFAKQGLTRSADARADLKRAHGLGCHPTWATALKGRLGNRYRGLLALE